MTRKIHVKKSEGEYVLPIEETPSETLFLSDLDHYAWLYLPLLYVYEGPDLTSSVNPCKLIKESLARALVYYYPLAGRLTFTDSAEGNGRYKVLCNKQGVLFIEAESSCTLEDVKYLTDEQAYTPSDLCDSMLPNISDKLTVFQIPLLAIQVTRFACGGFAFGMLTAHMMIDGIGLVYFLTTLVNIATGSRVPPFPHPVWERERLPWSSAGFNRNRGRPNGVGTTTQRVRRVNFCIPESTIKEIKTKIVKESDGDLEYCTSFEALCSSIWIAFINSTEGDVLPPAFAVNARDVFTPPMTPGFYGNCFMNTAVQIEDCDGKELRQLSRPDVVKAVRRAKGRITEEYLRGLIKEQMRVNGQMLVPYVGTVMLFSDWRLFGQPHFGWGQPMHMTCYFQPYTANTIFVPPTRTQPHTRARVFLQRDSRFSVFQSEMAMVGVVELSTNDALDFKRPIPRL